MSEMHKLKRKVCKKAGKNEVGDQLLGTFKNNKAVNPLTMKNACLTLRYQSLSTTKVNINNNIIPTCKSSR